MLTKRKKKKQQTNIIWISLMETDWCFTSFKSTDGACA